MTVKSQLRIEYRGRLAVTVRQVADQRHEDYNTLRQAVYDLEQHGLLKRLPEQIGRAALYDAEEIERALASRPGHGKAYPQTQDKRRKVA